MEDSISQKYTKGKIMQATQEQKLGNCHIGELFRLMYVE